MFSMGKHKVASSTHFPLHLLFSKKNLPRIISNEVLN